MVEKTPNEKDDITSIDLNKDLTDVNLEKLSDKMKEYLIATYVLDDGRFNKNYIKPHKFAEMLGYKFPFTTFDSIYKKARLKLLPAASSGMVMDVLFDFLKDKIVKSGLREEQLDSDVKFLQNQLYHILSREHIGEELNRDPVVINAFTKAWIELRGKQIEEGKMTAELFESWSKLTGTGTDKNSVSVNVNTNIENSITLEEFVKGVSSGDIILDKTDAE